MKQTIIFFLMLLFVSITQAQTSLDSIQKLDEVIISDVKLKRYTNGYKLTILSDSLLRKNPKSLTDLLRFNSNIYFKENGYGMVSSPSFRGTNASQTAVVWNGININSQLNGQVDFNLISSSNYDNISIRSGGGSVQYGSGAIGGSIHLSNDFNFEGHFDNRLQIGYGSFDTKNINYNGSFGTNKWSADVGVAYVNSENDYQFLGTDQTNDNGAFNNLDINLNIGRIVSQKDVIKLYHQNFRSDRELSSTLLADSKDKYETEDYRSMIEWFHTEENYSSSLKVVHLFEDFKYFENKELNNSSDGTANTWLIKHRYKRIFSKRFEFNLITDYSVITAKGDNFQDPKRNAFSATAILNHRLNSNFEYTLNVRKDVISDFESPLVFSGDMSYKVCKLYTLKFNASKNFRVPTFNDFYWNPGGNFDLVPEDSFQLDLGHDIEFSMLKMKLNTFYIETSNLIQWRPNAVLGFWTPINIANTKHFGIETELQLEKRIGNHNLLFSSSYTYTDAEDVNNNRKLIYVPEHLANMSLSYKYKSFSVFYQHLYNGQVEAIGNTLDAFDVGNMGLSYTFNTASKLIYGLDFRINNIYNTIYENVAFRPMPNRNFKIILTLKF